MRRFLRDMANAIVELFGAIGGMPYWPPREVWRWLRADGKT